jgi:hypothetical protein
MADLRTSGLLPTGATDDFFSRAGRNRHKHNNNKNSNKKQSRPSCKHCSLFLRELSTGVGLFYRTPVVAGLDATSDTSKLTVGSKRGFLVVQTALGVSEKEGETGAKPAKSAANADPAVVLRVASRFSGRETDRVDHDDGISILPDVRPGDAAYKALFGDELPVLVGSARHLSEESKLIGGWKERQKNLFDSQETVAWSPKEVDALSEGRLGWSFDPQSYYGTVLPVDWQPRHVADFLSAVSGLREMLSRGELRLIENNAGVPKGNKKGKAGGGAHARESKSAKKTKPRQKGNRAENELDSVLVARCVAERITGPVMLGWVDFAHESGKGKRKGNRPKEQDGFDWEERSLLVSQRLGLLDPRSGGNSIVAGRLVLRSLKDFAEYFEVHSRLPVEERIYRDRTGVRRPLAWRSRGERATRVFERDVTFSLPRGVVGGNVGDAGDVVEPLRASTNLLALSDDDVVFLEDAWGTLSDNNDSDDSSSDDGVLSDDADLRASSDRLRITAEEGDDFTDNEEEEDDSAASEDTDIVVCITQVVPEEFAVVVAATEDLRGLRGKASRQALLGQKQLSSRLVCPHGSTHSYHERAKQRRGGRKLHVDHHASRKEIRDRGHDIFGKEDAVGKRRTPYW